MVVLGAVLGAITFFIQGSVQWDGSHVATSLVMVALLCAMFLFLLCPVQDMRCVEMARCSRLTVRHGLCFRVYREYLLRIVYS